MSDRDNVLLQELQRLERELQSLPCMHDRARLDVLLAEGFVEFGRSGQRYGKREIIELLLQAESAQAWSQDFALTRLAEQAALLTYRSARLLPDGDLERHSQRSSIWKAGPSGWQLLFHQGTATAPFEKSTA